MGSSTSPRDIDVLVVGAGPAGATAALNLAPIRQVALVDLRSQPRPRIGESLPPAARRLLSDMGLWDSFTAEGHSPCYGNRAVWSSPEPVETDFLRDPDGHGWHIDRARFELWLRDCAVDRGAMLVAPGRMQAIRRDGQRWCVELRTDAGPLDIRARLVIDAGGRAAPVGRALGACRHRHDKLFCGWLYGEASAVGPGAGFTFVQAAEDGWWYTASVPGGRRVMAFHSDSDLPQARGLTDPGRLMERAAAHPELAAILVGSHFTPTNQFGVTAAQSARLRPFVGASWLAVGDAAFSCDPLSCQGLLNALYTGLMGAQAADRCLSGDDDALREYGQALTQVHTVYRRRLAYWYGAETRWSNAPFWQRRHSALDDA